MPPPPPELSDDLLGEAFLRLPPDDPASLIRASLACKHWRRILADPVFRRRHRELHPPSVLGFLYGSRFVPINPDSRRPAARDLPAGMEVLDCRHGRVLLRAPSPLLGTDLNYDLVVWDPLTDKQRCLPRLLPPLTELCGRSFNGAVLCSAAVEGCDHTICPGGPFHVAFICRHEHVMYARLYSSKTDNWSDAISLQLPPLHPGRRYLGMLPNLPCTNTLVGDTLYFHEKSEYAWEYQLGAQRLSIFQGPPRPVSEMSRFFMMPLRDGALGCMGIEEDESSLRLQLWSRDAASDTDKVARWTRGRAIDLEKLLPDGALPSPRWAPDARYTRSVRLLGFAEDTDVIFVGTMVHTVQRNKPQAVYMVQLNSRRATKVLEFPLTWRRICYPYIIPYTSVPVIHDSSINEWPGDDASSA